MKSSSAFQPADSQPNNRRRYSRYTSESHDIHVHAGSRTVQGKLVDESIGGLAMLTTEANCLSVGQVVEMIIRDDTSKGYIRSVDAETDGNYRVSISWEKRPFREANTIVTYMLHDEMLLACQILCDQTGPIRLVRLWDGAEFQVVSDSVCTRSYEERRDELNTTPTLLPVLVQLYGLNEQADACNVITDILDFEFSSQFDAPRQASPDNS